MKVVAYSVCMLLSSAQITSFARWIHGEVHGVLVSPRLKYFSMLLCIASFPMFESYFNDLMYTTTSAFNSGFTILFWAQSCRGLNSRPFPIYSHPINSFNSSRPMKHLILPFRLPAANKSEDFNMICGCAQLETVHNTLIHKQLS